MERKFRFGDFVLDTARRELTRELERVALEPKHLSLLELLIESAPAAVSKERIYDTLWPDVVVAEANIHNLISELRRALGEESRELIRTVHGHGYSFTGNVDEQSHWELAIGNRVHRLFTGTNVVGRGSEADVVIDYPGISRLHALIRVVGDEITVEDLGSKNGTHVNGSRITRRTPAGQRDSILFSQLPAVLRRSTQMDATQTE